MKTHRASYQVIERNAPSTGAVRSAIRVLLALADHGNAPHTNDERQAQEHRDQEAA